MPAPRFVRRVVFGLPSLREKLLCIDHGLDDITMELTKIHLLREHFPKWASWKAQVSLQELRDDHLHFDITAPPAKDSLEVAAKLATPMATYHEVNAARGGRPSPFHPWLVDFRAALAPQKTLPRLSRADAEAIFKDPYELAP